MTPLSSVVHGSTFRRMTKRAAAAVYDAPPRGLSPADVATALGLSRKTVYRMIERGDLVAVRVGPSLIRIPETEVARLLKPRARRRRRAG